MLVRFDSKLVPDNWYLFKQVFTSKISKNLLNFFGPSFIYFNLAELIWCSAQALSILLRLFGTRYNYSSVKCYHYKETKLIVLYYVTTCKLEEFTQFLFLFFFSKGLLFAFRLLELGTGKFDYKMVSFWKKWISEKWQCQNCPIIGTL